MRGDLDDRGSLLIEVLLAMMILTISLIPILGSLTIATKASIISKEQTQVSFLLEKETEIIMANYRGDTFGDIDDDPGVFENYSESGFTLHRTVSEASVTDADGQQVMLDADYVKNIDIVIMKDDKTYGQTSFLLYYWGYEE